MNCWMTPQVTVVSATAFKLDSHLAAIQKTIAALPFPAKGLLISHKSPKQESDIQWQQIPKEWIRRGRWTREEYSEFMLFGMPKFIDTNHVITVQWDGYGANPSMWRDEFLDYDYIGAPWPAFLNVGRVGNGGFSMRSMRWIDLALQLRMPFHAMGVHGSEDCYSCTKYRHKYEDAGMAIAPLDVAMRWSLEHPVEEYPDWTSDQSFGFHGFFHPSNLKHQLPPDFT